MLLETCTYISEVEAGTNQVLCFFSFSLDHVGHVEEESIELEAVTDWVR